MSFLGVGMVQVLFVCMCALGLSPPKVPTPSELISQVPHIPS